MKALGVNTVPKGDWRLEIKFDGYRAVAVINQGAVELWSRNQKILTGDYPEVVAELESLSCQDAVLDGEIVALDPEGRARFQLLQNRSGGERPPIVYYVFDVMFCEGDSLIHQPFEIRQKVLSALLKKGFRFIRQSPVFSVTPAVLMAEAKANGLEGVIAKAAGSLYEPDQRSGAWLKCKLFGEQEFVIGGFTPPRHSRACFGAILVGYYQHGKLRYAGKVGSGFNRVLLGSLHAEFLKRQISECPFSDLPLTHRSRFGVSMTAAAMREVTWIKPVLVGQVRFAEWTDEGLLRQPVFLGLRQDKNAREVRREAPSVSVI